MSKPLLNALMLLKKEGYITQPKDCEYLGFIGGEHQFVLTNNKFVSVDLVIEKVNIL